MAPKGSNPVQKAAGVASVEPVRPAERPQAAHSEPWRWGATLVDPEHLKVCADRIWREPAENP